VIFPKPLAPNNKALWPSVFFKIVGTVYPNFVKRPLFVRFLYFPFLDPRTRYAKAQFESTLEVELAISLANKNPSAAVNMVKAIMQKDPKNASNLATALRTIEAIDIGKLYPAITSPAPQMSIHIAEALTNALQNKRINLIGSHRSMGIARVNRKPIMVSKGTYLLIVREISLASPLLKQLVAKLTMPLQERRFGN
jgi:hypothetical protein